MMDYPLCHQTVTLYRIGNGGVTRQVINGCYYEKSRVLEVRDLGLQQETKFLLILPGQLQQVFVGDKVYFGIGPEIKVEQWARFSSATDAKVGEVAYATPYFRNGRLCHTEAGRK